MIQQIQTWFDLQGWQPREYQEQSWRAFLAGEHGLVNVPTGSGKTYSALMGPLATLSKEPNPSGLTILYISPLRALGHDIQLAVEKPVRWFDPRISVGMRTGDTGVKERAAQKKRLPQVLITTPESLALLLTEKNRKSLFGGLSCVIVDEWHELMRSKRGNLLELNLRWLQHLSPKLRIWGLSATLGNIDEAARMLVGEGQQIRLVQAPLDREVCIKVLVPDDPTQIPATGHYGTRMGSVLLADLDLKEPSIVFTNTRAQAERWFEMIQQALPRDQVAIHHGSLDREVRQQVEAGIKSGKIKIVVATSSLDLGVDYSPVRRVYQIGSPKAVARLIQRAGRGFHTPGSPCEIRYLPTYGLELLEIDAVKCAIANKQVEEQGHFEKPFDVLTQFLVNCAIGDGFDADELFRVVRKTYSFRDLTRSEFNWAIAFAGKGGESLSAYPQFQRFTEEDGRYLCKDRRIILDHKMNVGTILSDATIPLKLQRGGLIGSIEERFILGLKPGDVFQFGGENLSFVRLSEQHALVTRAQKKARITPRWFGSKFAFSPVVTRNLRKILSEEGHQRHGAPIVRAQKRTSELPKTDEILVELGRFQGDYCLFCYPMEGEYVNQALAVLTSLRLSRGVETTFKVTANDYGFGLISGEDFPFRENLSPQIFSLTNLAADIEEGINLSQFAKKHFREICRIAGLVKQTQGGNKKSMRQMSMSSGLLFDVFQKFDPENKLLLQSRHEILHHEFDYRRLAAAMTYLSGQKIRLVELAELSPLALPLAVESLGNEFSTESMGARVERIQESWYGDD